MRFIAHKYSRQLILLLIADIALFSLTDAQTVPSFLLIIGFLLLAATTYHLIRGVLALFKIYGLRVERKRRLATYGTGLIGGVIALQSMGQLNSRDILVLIPLAILGYLYSYYVQADRRRATA